MVLSLFHISARDDLNTPSNTLQCKSFAGKAKLTRYFFIMLGYTSVSKDCQVFFPPMYSSTREPKLFTLQRLLKIIDVFVVIPIGMNGARGHAKCGLFAMVMAACGFLQLLIRPGRCLCDLFQAVKFSLRFRLMGI